MEKPQLKDKIALDLKDAMKQKAARRVSVLRLISADIKNFEIDQQKPAGGEDVLKILEKRAKKHQDSIAQFQAGGRTDLATQETEELAIVQSYLPEPLSDAELDSLVAEAVNRAGATSSADFGKVMKILMPQVAGRASGQTVSQKLKAQLTS